MTGDSAQGELDDRAAERGLGREETGRGPTGDGSSHSAARRAGFPALGGSITAVTLIGAAAGLLLLVSEFLTVASVNVAGGSCEVINDADPALADRCSLSGFERHGGAFLLLGLLCLAMAWGAGQGRSRPAAIALVLVGAIVLVWAFALDLPQTHETGAIGQNFEGAAAKAGPGLYAEIAAGLLALLAGGLRLRSGPSP